MSLVAALIFLFGFLFLLFLVFGFLVFMDSGELSDASKEIEKLIHLCEEVGVVKVSTVYFLWLGFCT